MGRRKNEYLPIALVLLLILLLHPPLLRPPLLPTLPSRSCEFQAGAAAVHKKIRTPLDRLLFLPADQPNRKFSLSRRMLHKNCQEHGTILCATTKACSSVCSIYAKGLSQICLSLCPSLSFSVAFSPTFSHAAFFAFPPRLFFRLRGGGIGEGISGGKGGGISVGIFTCIPPYPPTKNIGKI